MCMSSLPCPLLTTNSQTKSGILFERTNQTPNFKFGPGPLDIDLFESYRAICLGFARPNIFARGICYSLHRSIDTCHCQSHEIP